ncbi:MAG: 3'-5' exonuclease [Salinibacterium sp.]|nr:3'-5' exonuclease [Salinibacterium sp.]
MSASWFDTLAVFDLETTGIDVETSHVVSAHVGVIAADGSVIEQLDWLADPGVEIPAGASAVHGITTERARVEGRPAPHVISEIVAALQSVFERGLALTVYNARYDLTLLNRECRRHGLAALIEPNPVIDPLVIDKAVDRFRKGKRTLEAAAQFYAVDLTDAHNAGADAVAAGRVAQAIARRYPTELALPAAELHSKQIAWSAEQDASFAEYMRRTRDPNFVSTHGAWPQS